MPSGIAWCEYQLSFGERAKIGLIIGVFRAEMEELMDPGVARKLRSWQYKEAMVELLRRGSRRTLFSTHALRHCLSSGLISPVVL